MSGPQESDLRLEILAVMKKPLADEVKERQIARIAENLLSFLDGEDDGPDHMLIRAYVMLVKTECECEGDLQGEDWKLCRCKRCDLLREIEDEVLS